MMLLSLSFDKSQAQVFIDTLPGTIYRVQRSVVARTNSYAKKEM